MLVVAFVFSYVNAGPEQRFRASRGLVCVTLYLRLCSPWSRMFLVETSREVKRDRVERGLGLVGWDEASHLRYGEDTTLLFYFEGLVVSRTLLPSY